MKPDKDSNVIRIAMTMDLKNKAEMPMEYRFFFSILAIVGSIVVTIALGLIIQDTVKTIILGIIIVSIIQFVVRRAIIKEHVYKKSIMDLEAINFKAPYKDFVSISSIDAFVPYLVRFSTGHIGYYIKLEKGSNIGKGQYGEYEHHEAIADAFRFLLRRGLKAKHVDYMESNSADVRLQRLKSQYANTPDTLKKYLYEKYNYMEEVMTQNSLSHDVFLVTTDREDIDEKGLHNIITEFSQFLIKANYSRVIVLTEQEVESVIGVVLNSEQINFVDIKAQLSEDVASKVLRKIYTVDDNGIMTKHNKTMEELGHATRISQNERKARFSRFFGKFKKEDNDNIDW